MKKNKKILLSLLLIVTTLCIDINIFDQISISSNIENTVIGGIDDNNETI